MTDTSDTPSVAVPSSIEALAEALHTPPNCKFHDHDVNLHESHAASILAALPEGVHLFTVETLAARLCARYCDPSHLWADCPVDENYRGDAAAIIQAAQEADRE